MRNAKIIRQCLAIALAAALFMTAGFALSGMSAAAEQIAPAADPSPAIYVAQKNANSVVGIVTNEEHWNRQTRQVERRAVASGSGVVYKDGGYILTNQHVIDNGSGFQVLLPWGELVDAELVGSDSATDIAVLRIDEKSAADLVPVEVGSTSDLLPGSTVVAIGNPGGEDLANTITQGIVSALNRNTVAPDPRPSQRGTPVASRVTSYIQHDAALNPGNSGGGLFNYKGLLVGLNNWKVGGTGSSQLVPEGLGFAIPVETAVRIADQLIENGKVVRPALGVTVSDMDGPDEPLNSFPPKSVMVYTVRDGGAAAQAGVKQYDCIYSVEGVRVTTTRELITELDKHQAGDTITVRLVRFRNVTVNEAPETIDVFGNRSSGGLEQPSFSGGFEFIEAQVTLETLEQ